MLFEEWSRVPVMRPTLSITVCLLAAGAYAGTNPQDLFEKPVALTDGSGAPLLTGKAQGCPYAADFNADGKVDLILGAKDGMDTATGGIWLIPNSGSNAKPAFSFATAVRACDAGGPVNIGCG